MKSKLVFLVLLQLTFTEFVIPQENLIVNVMNRSSFSLNGYWSYIVDPYENGYYNYRYITFDSYENPGKGAYFTNAKPENKSDLVEYDFDKSPKIQVPGDWNSQKKIYSIMKEQFGIKKSFDYKKQSVSNRVFVYFSAINYQADVYLNGKKLGQHIGGFTPFNFEITDLIKEKENFLIVKVDNKRKKESVPTLNTDWWNYGGITREVKIVETPQNFIKDYFIQLDRENSEIIKGFVRLNGENISDREVTISLSEPGLEKKYFTDENGYLEFLLKSGN